MTERRACRLANQPRGTQRYRAIRREDEDALTQEIVQLAIVNHGRYGYRRIHGAAQKTSRLGRWAKTRWMRIWRREGLKVPQKRRSHEDGCGSTMVHACGSGHYIATMCGAGRLRQRAWTPMMPAAYGSST